MKVRDIMTSVGDTKFVLPDTSITEVAQLLRDLDIGSLPVCERGRLIGMITDRDIVVRAVAAGLATDLTASDIMSIGVIHTEPDQTIAESAALMEHYQVRRLPVLDKNRRLIGIISLGDIALDGKSALSGHALKEISRRRAEVISPIAQSVSE